MAGHGTKPPKGQGGLDAAGITYLKDTVKGCLQGAVLVGWEPAEQDAHGLYLVKANALHSSEGSWATREHIGACHQDYLIAAHHPCTNCCARKRKDCTELGIAVR